MQVKEQILKLAAEATEEAPSSDPLSLQTPPRKSRLPPRNVLDAAVLSDADGDEAVGPATVPILAMTARVHAAADGRLGHGRPVHVAAIHGRRD